MGEGVAQFERMLNPAFCGVLATALVEGACYRQSVAADGIPLVSIYLLMPMVLHQRTAVLIDKFDGGQLVDFVGRYPNLIIGLDRRITITRNSVRAGVAFALQRGALRFDSSAERLCPTDALKSIRTRLREVLASDDERRISVCSKLGQWSSNMSLALLCNVLAVRPVWHISQVNTIGDAVTPKEIAEQ